MSDKPAITLDLSGMPCPADDIGAWNKTTGVEPLAKLPIARGAQEFYLRRK